MIRSFWRRAHGPASRSTSSAETMCRHWSKVFTGRRPPWWHARRRSRRPNSGSLEMISRELRWFWQDRDIVLGLDEAGSGPLLLLLPALSSISTRAEMHPLMERLAAQFRVVALDWPGFGTAPRPDLRWTPDALSAFLDHA